MTIKEEDEDVSSSSHESDYLDEEDDEAAENSNSDENEDDQPGEGEAGQNDDQKNEPEGQNEEVKKEDGKDEGGERKMSEADDVLFGAESEKKGDEEGRTERISMVVSGVNVFQNATEGATPEEPASEAPPVPTETPKFVPDKKISFDETQDPENSKNDENVANAETLPSFGGPSPNSENPSPTPVTPEKPSVNPQISLGDSDGTPSEASPEPQAQISLEISEKSQKSQKSFVKQIKKLINPQVTEFDSEIVRFSDPTIGNKFGCD